MKMDEKIIKDWCYDFLKEFKNIVEEEYKEFAFKLPLYNYYPPIVHIYLCSDYFEAVFEARKGDEQKEPEINIHIMEDAQTVKVNSDFRAGELEIRGKLVARVAMNEFQFKKFQKSANFANFFLEKELAKIAPLKGKFQFVDFDKLREILERDYLEAEISYQAGAYKATLLLYGSIIEALLLFFLKKQENQAISELKKAFPKASKKLEDCNLFYLTEVARRIGIISPNTAKLSDLIREYRNLIHPAVEIRTEIEPDKSLANISRELLGLVLKDIEKKA